MNPPKTTPPFLPLKSSPTELLKQALPGRSPERRWADTPELAYPTPYSEGRASTASWEKSAQANSPTSAAARVLFST